MLLDTRGAMWRFEMYQSIIRPLLFALSSQDAERAHNLTIRLFELMQRPSILNAVARHFQPTTQVPVTIAGITFPHRVGLAAGFDKQARMLPMLQALGFGHVEVGTILPLYQKGNPRPRVFRYPEHEALFNRMGFNSDGVLAVRSRLERVRNSIHIPLGASLSMQKTTPLSEAAQDYVAVLNEIGRFFDYYAVNVSSPNTPGLRELQGGNYLEHLVRAVVDAERARAMREGGREKPIFVKVALDLTEAELDESLDASARGGAQGFIFANTSIRFPPTGFPSGQAKEMVGGWSAPSNRGRMLQMVRQARSQYPHHAIIAVTGIGHRGHILQARKAGADLVQIYSSFIYQGPSVVRRLASVKW